MTRESEIITEIEKNKYRIERKIGEGSYGEIFLATMIETQRKVAIKITQFDKKEESVRKVYNREVKIAKLIPTHSNIVQIIDEYIIDEEFGVMVMERMEMDLMEYILTSPKLSLKEIIKVFVEICKGVQFLHQQKIAHCDLKPENILINMENGMIKEVKLCDFGFAVDLRNDLNKSQRFGTEEYLCPEAQKFEEKINAEKVDMWSIAVIFFVLMTGLFPFVKRNNSTFGLNYFNLHKMILDYKFDDSEDDFGKTLQLFVPQWIDMLNNLFSINPLDRPSVDQILNLPFIVTIMHQPEEEFSQSNMRITSAIGDIENSSLSRKSKKKRSLLKRVLQFPKLIR